MIEYFLKTRAIQVTGYYCVNDLLHLAVEAMERDLQQIGDDINLRSVYITEIYKTFAAYAMAVPKETKRILK